MMWASLAVGLLGQPWARRMAAYALVALTIALFIVNLRRQGERAGRVAERLETLERTNAIHRQMLDAAARRPRSRDDLLDRLREGWF
jgi:type II secretory pathway component PulJ